jgi:hypothetical protein
MIGLTDVWLPFKYPTLSPNSQYKLQIEYEHFETLMPKLI